MIKSLDMGLFDIYPFIILWENKQSLLWPFKSLLNLYTIKRTI